ncbi:MAG: glycosyl transferase family protein [Pontibacterium sp.]
MKQEHAFAPYVRILGKGKKGTRALTREEAADAMGMILDGRVRPEQLGAFLMLLRVKEEAPEELAGFADAVQARFETPASLKVDLDWSTYAGKKRRHPWFLLAALCLAGHGYRIFMHGAHGHTAERIYTEDMLPLFGLKGCDSWQVAELELERTNFAFMSIDRLCPPLGEMIQLRSVLGLRSPVHTLCRMLNPLKARCSVDGVFHPPYGPMHQQTAQLLGFERNLTIKGDGGEAEVKPDGESVLQWVTDGHLNETQWPRLVERRFVKEDPLEPALIAQVWRGEVSHEYGELAIVSTLALLLKLLGDEAERSELLNKAERLWAGRHINHFQSA